VSQSKSWQAEQKQRKPYSPVSTPTPDGMGRTARHTSTWDDVENFSGSKLSILLAWILHEAGSAQFVPE
jgi:hypothetical protein